MLLRLPWCGLHESIGQQAKASATASQQVGAEDMFAAPEAVEQSTAGNSDVIASASPDALNISEATNTPLLVVSDIADPPCVVDESGEEESDGVADAGDKGAAGNATVADASPS